MSNLEEFVALAQEFSNWSLSLSVDELEEARKAQSFLSRLYTQALELSEPDEMDDNLEGTRTNDEAWNAICKRANSSLPFAMYSMTLDSLDFLNEEIGICSLGDDIADIHRDLSEGLSLYRDGYHAEAEWIFLFTFRAHWGQHASSALFALHRWFIDSGNC